MAPRQIENGIYSFLSVSCSIVGPGLKQSIQGAAEEGYSVELENDVDALTMGADGSGMHSIRAAQNGTVTLRLLKTSILNQALCIAYNYQRQAAIYSGQNVITLRDPVRNDTITAQGAGFRRFPNISYAMDGGTQDWAFICTRIDFDLGPGIITQLVAGA